VSDAPRHADADSGADARRRTRAAVPIALAVLALILLALFREAVFEGEVLSQADALYQHEPWRAVRPEGLVPGNPSLIDQASQFQPWLMHMQRRLAQGELPLWNGLSAGGEPFIANLQSGVFSPFHVFAHFLPFGIALLAIALAKLMVAGFGTALLARRLGCSAPACVLAAVAYTLGGYQFLWLGHPHSGASAMLPLLLYLVERWCTSPSRWLRPGFALGVACLLFAGHVETALHVALAVGLYAAVRSTGRALSERLALLGDITLWALVGLAIACVQMVPFAEYLALSEIFAKRVAFRDVWHGIPWRLTPWVLLAGAVALGAVASGRAAARAAGGRRWLLALGCALGLAALGALALGGLEALGLSPLYRLLLHPDAYGHPVPAHGMPYAGPRSYVNINGGYVGLIALPLALFAVLCGPRRHRGIAAFGALWVFSAILAFELPLISDLLNRLPLLDLSLNYRMTLVVGFSGAMLAAFGLDALLKTAGRRRPPRVFWVCLPALVAALWIAPQLPLSNLPSRAPSSMAAMPTGGAIEGVADVGDVGDVGAENGSVSAGAGVLPAVVVGKLAPMPALIGAGRPLELSGWALGPDGLPPDVLIELAQSGVEHTQSVRPDLDPRRELSLPSDRLPPQSLASLPGAARSGWRVELDLSMFRAGPIRVRVSLRGSGPDDAPPQRIFEDNLKYLADVPVERRWWVLGGLGLLLLALGSLRLRGAGWLGPAFALLLCADMYSFARDFNPTTPPELVFPRTPVTDFIARQPGTFRIWAVGRDVLMPNTALVYGLSDVRRYDAMSIDRFSLFMSMLSPPAERAVAPGESLDVGHPLFDLLDVRYVLAPSDWTPPPGADLVQVFADGGLVVLENRRATQRAFVATRARSIDAYLHAQAHPGENDLAARRRHAGNVGAAIAGAYRERYDPHDTLVIEGDWTVMEESLAPLEDEARTEARVIEIERTDERLVYEVESARPGWLFVGDSDFPGWVAHVNGVQTSIAPAFFAFRAVPVPAGRSDVVFEYMAYSVRAGMIATGVGLGLLFLGMLLAVRGSLRDRA
jgi:hypothetical protein